MTGFADRVALVTGASSGIGLATAELLAAAGARVMGVGRSEERLADLAARTGAATIARSLDTSEACDDVVAETRHRLGPIDILVCSAGRGGHHDDPIWEQSLEGWRATMAVNLDAPFVLTKAAAADMRNGGWGRIVYVSSTAGEVGAPALGPYCASKHGVIGLARSVAHDIGTFGATCNAVLPGWVRTPIADADVEREAAARGLAPDAVWAEHDASSPRGRSLDAVEVARVIAWLVSDEAAGVNGEALTVALGGVW
ncbi:MAG TPA: SDR family oxidoreductase [Actinomycetota bacterium]|nr:SDR family oxidoreductase [Actinomycetota bacterium]